VEFLFKQLEGHAISAVATAHLPQRRRFLDNGLGILAAAIGILARLDGQPRMVPIETVYEGHFVAAILKDGSYGEQA
jgi:hypothetical protein